MAAPIPFAPHAKESSIAKSLPAYCVTRPAPSSPDSPPITRLLPFLKRRRLRFVLILITIIIAIIVVTVLGVKLHQKSIKDEGPVDPSKVRGWLLVQ
ncbi:hypothetical protein BDZ45DRAFT_800483 [Acephala macrosclerotiorum]|nr:hypothetical protein BDZ45DRAFT_800483 [Acephala macrosclerotiorum]